MSWDVTLSSGMFLRQPLLQVLALIGQAGFHRIQVSAFPSHFDYHDRDAISRVRQGMNGLGLRATSLHAAYSEEIDLTLLEEQQRLRAVAEVKAAADALAALGGSTLVLHAGSTAEKANQQVAWRLRQSVSSLEAIYNYCQKRSLNLALEDMLGHLVGGRTEELEWMLAQLPEQGVGFCLDRGHSFLARSLLERVRLFGPRPIMVHAHDN